jgi:hypothetical protein
LKRGDPRCCRGHWIKKCWKRAACSVRVDGRARLGTGSGDRGSRLWGWRDGCNSTSGVPAVAAEINPGHRSPSRAPVAHTQRTDKLLLPLIEPCGHGVVARRNKVLRIVPSRRCQDGLSGGRNQTFAQTMSCWRRSRSVLRERGRNAATGGGSRNRLPWPDRSCFTRAAGSSCRRRSVRPCGRVSSLAGRSCGSGSRPGRAPSRRP